MRKKLLSLSPMSSLDRETVVKGSPATGENPTRPRSLDLAMLGAMTLQSNPNKKLAVVLHLYYENQLPEVIRHLNNLQKANIAYDLFITTPNATKIHSLYTSLPPRRGKLLSLLPSPSPRWLCASHLSLRGERDAKSNSPLKQFSNELAEWLPHFVGGKFCERTADVLLGRGAYKEVRDPTDDRHPTASHFTKFIPTKNRGYDVAPFIATLRHLDLSRYDYVLKLHTKNQNKNAYTILNNRRLSNRIWSKMMWNALLGTPEKIRENLQMLEADPTIGMLAAKYCLTDEKRCYETLLPQINKELAALGFPAMERLTFAAGTTFLARTEVLKPLLKYRLEDFPPTDGKVKEGTLAHVVERLFGAVTEAAGYRVVGVSHKRYRIARTLAAIKRFFYQKKQTKKGYTLIKICKIPICHLPASP